MDSLLTAAARALAKGDPLGALERVALREDAPAVAMRGIAMAQLGELASSRKLLRRAVRAFEPGEVVARARCVVAAAEVALAARELAPVRGLAEALRELEARGDRFNALYGRLVVVRRELLFGRVDGAAGALGELELAGAPPLLAAVGELCAAEVAVRRVRTGEADAAMARAREAAGAAGVPALVAEIERAREALELPAARLVAQGTTRALRLAGVERVLASGDLVVDACRRRVVVGEDAVSLARRPVLFELALALAEAGPAGATREELVRRAFDARVADESHRASLRVEVGRLRRALGRLAGVRATADGFALEPRGGGDVVVLRPPVDGAAGALVALLADGRPWSTSALALALGSSQRTVQRALGDLEAAGDVRAIGRARARRWLAPPAVGFTTTLLLPAP